MVLGVLSWGRTAIVATDGYSIPEERKLDKEETDEEEEEEARARARAQAQAQAQAQEDQ